MAALAALLLSMTIPPPAIDPAPGAYVFQGSCPSASAYRGHLTIRREGLFYALTWQFDGGGAVVGTAMLRERRLLVAFHLAGGADGLMDMAEEGDGWRGTWAFFNGREMCEETWTRA